MVGCTGGIRARRLRSQPPSQCVWPMRMGRSKSKLVRENYGPSRYLSGRWSVALLQVIAFGAARGVQAANMCIHYRGMRVRLVCTPREHDWRCSVRGVFGFAWRMRTQTSEATYRAAILRWPAARITLRQGIAFSKSGPVQTPITRRADRGMAVGVS